MICPPAAAPSISFRTLGCRLNQAETSVLEALFRARGYRVARSDRCADICVINTCCVTHVGEQKCRQAIRAAARQPRRPAVVVAGCYAETGAALLASLPGVRLVVGAADKMRLPDLVDAMRRDTARKAGATDGPRVIAGPIPREPFRMPAAACPSPGAAAGGGSTRALLKVQDGCDFGCSYCIIPRSRGPARSRVFEDVDRAARGLAARGFREIVLTGVNIGTYADSGRDLGDVLDAVSQIDGVERSYAAVRYEPGDVLVFGSEGQGLPAEFRERHAARAVRIPMAEPRVRSLNLATAVGIGLYEALRQLGRL